MATGPIRASPVIAIDGPAASGTGTVAERVGRDHGVRYLESGALYRLTALKAIRGGVSFADPAALAAAAGAMLVDFRDARTWLDGEDVTAALRGEDVGAAASRVAAVPAVREQLLQRQRGFRSPPGLVAEGRDMGSVVFPDAVLKVFLTAALETRARRRYKQLMGKGMYAKMPDVVEELRRRDERDSNRPVAPLKHYPDAVFLDTTGISVDEAVRTILAEWRNRVAG